MATSSGSRDFNGSSDGIDSGNSADFNLSAGNDMSVGCWVKPDIVNQERAICGTIANGWSFGTVPSSYEIGVSISAVGHRPSGLSISANVWTFVGFSWDVATDIDFVTITSSGVVSTATNTTTSTPAAGGTLVVGNNSNAAAYWDGGISHIQIWNRILSDEELICAAYRPGSVANSMILYWPMYGQISPEQDLGSNQYTATITGTTATSDSPNLAIPIG